MKKIDKLRKEILAIESEIKNLLNFRDTSTLRKFKRQLQGEKSNILDQIKKLTETVQEKTARQVKIIQNANKNRSAKNKRNWNYVKSVRDNYFPEKSLKEIRSSLKKHRHGLETDIPDVAWRNPSP